MLNYIKIENPRGIFECCDFPKPPYDPGTGDCCYDYWNADLSDVTNELRCVTSIAKHKQNEYQFISDWYTVVNGWRTDWETADSKADALCRSLELFIKHLDRVCKITKKTARAIDILFCMIEDLYVRVDCLKEKYDQLIKCISCLKHPALQSGGIITCLTNYGAKLDLVIATRDILISKVIIAIEYSYELHDNICNDYGLKEILVYWTQVLNCGGKSDSDCDPDGKEETDDRGRRRCKLEPRITFSIDASEYYKHLVKLSEEAKIRMQDLKKESDKANEKKAALEACKNGLDKAIAAAGPAAKCGNGSVPA